MVAEARHDAILRELELRGTLSSSEMASRLRVSAMTVRRDLQDLERRGLLRRVHGGAAHTRAPGARTPTHPVATIGMLVPTTTYYFPEVIRGAAEAAGGLNCRLIVGATDYSPDEELRQAARMMAAGVDALMITPHADLASGSPLRDLLEAAAIPVVLVERALDDRVAERLDWVRSDHAAGAETAVDHLLSLGHSRIVLAARPAATVGALREGFDRRLSDNASVAVGTWHPLSTPPAGRGVLIPELEALIDTCLDERATAALILGDADAMAFADLVIGRGLRIPEDIAIVAYDDEISGHAAIPLTAVAPPKRELGSAAVRLCMDRMRQHEHGSQTIIRMVMLPTLVARESTIGAGAA